MWKVEHLCFFCGVFVLIRQTALDERASGDIISPQAISLWSHTTDRKVRLGIYERAKLSVCNYCIMMLCVCCVEKT